MALSSTSTSPGVSSSPQASPISSTDDPNQQSTSSPPPPPTAEDASPSSSSLSPSLSPSASPPRPNKYHGPPSTWRNWTAPERDLATSLDQIRASDLSIHLYNAFALKERAGKRHFGRPPIGADRDGNEGDEDAAWAPPRVWTAWPMRVDEVPREEEKGKWEDADTPKRPALRKPRRPGDALKELLVARVLKKAKERFEAREWEDGQSEDEEEPARTSRRKNQSRRKSKGRSSQARTDDDYRSNMGTFAIRKRLLRPVVMTDDDIATTLLKPSIQHILTKLDDLLLGLHRARAAYASTKPGKRSQQPDPDSTDPTSTRHRGRKRTRSKMQSPHPQSSDSDSESNFSTSKPPSRHRHRHRRRRTSSPSSQSQDAMSISPPSPSKPHSKPNRTPQKSHYKASFAPRDWSDVLGLAALTGWDSAIVHKAAERCADLFGEGVAFRVFGAGSRAEGHGRVWSVGTEEGGGGVKGREGCGSGGWGEGEGEGEGGMYGGVHIDGFMQPIKGKRWWGRDSTGRIASASRVYGRKKKGDAGDVTVRDADGGESGSGSDEEEDNDETEDEEEDSNDEDGNGDSDDDNDDDDDDNAENRTTNPKALQSEDSTGEESVSDISISTTDRRREYDIEDDDDQENNLPGDEDDNSDDESPDIQELHSDSDDDSGDDAISTDGDEAEVDEMEIEGEQVRGRGRQMSIEL